MLKGINWILLGLAGAAVLVCGIFGIQYLTFPGETYAETASSLRQEAEEIRAETKQLEADLEAYSHSLETDIAQIGDEGAAVAEQLTALETRREEVSAAITLAKERVKFAENAYENMLALRKEYAEKIRRLEDMIIAGETDVKICYWTLDDGPSYLTDEFLDAIKDLGIYVTFFTSRAANSSGANDDPEAERVLLRREIMEGHAIGNHTNAHDTSYSGGIPRFFEQVDLQDQWLTDCTGIKPDIFRFPGGSGWAFSWIPKDEAVSGLEERGYKWIDWSCDVYDNAANNPSAYEVYSTALYEIKTLDIALVLSHDWNINTLGGLQKAVPELQEAGYVFLPLFTDSWTMENTKILFG